MIKLKSSKETPLKGCNCGNKLNHWKKFTGMQVRMCFVPGCRNSEIDGSYVVKTKADAETNLPLDSTIYLIPLCEKHATTTEEFEVADDTNFVSTILKETCGRNDAMEVKEGEL